MIRELSEESSRKPNPIPTQEVTLLPLPTKSFALPLTNVGSAYLIPSARNFESVDLISTRSPYSLFQMTIADTHSIKSNGLKVILEHLKDAYNWKETDRIRLYIVVPDDVFDTFQKLPKIISSVDQYALRIKLT